jgi:hypothetical protein
MNKKCPYCGFINFADAEDCRKCETVLTELLDHPTFNDRPTYRGGVSSNRQPYKTERSFTFNKLLICIAGMLFGASVYVMAIRPHVLAFFTGSCDWTEFRPDGTNLTVTMPGPPSKADPGAAPPEARYVLGHTFASEVTGQGVAGFTYVDFPEPKDMSKSEQLLNTALDGSLTQTASTLVSKKMINYYGMPGLEFECVPPEKTFQKPARCYGKFFITSNRLYMLFIAGVEDSELLAGRDKFLNPRLGSVASKE